MTIAFLFLLENINNKYAKLYDRGQKVSKEQATSRWDWLLEDCIHNSIEIDKKSVDNLDNREELYADNSLYTRFEPI